MVILENIYAKIEFRIKLLKLKIPCSTSHFVECFGIKLIPKEKVVGNWVIKIRSAIYMKWYQSI
jgi:hypothetical protein